MQVTALGVLPHGASPVILIGGSLVAAALHGTAFSGLRGYQRSPVRPPTRPWRPRRRRPAAIPGARR
ncbi:MAG TPA: hypothetical protein VKF59_13105 [Candidatus Dormibacteraeota bacterium]|nr:hypothetical protein [Candidatus Dormibacteraeota bacterium]